MNKLDKRTSFVFRLPSQQFTVRLLSALWLVHECVKTWIVRALQAVSSSWGQFKIEACPKQGLYVKTVYVRFTIPPSTTMYDVFPLGQDSRCNILGLVLLIVL